MNKSFLLLTTALISQIAISADSTTAVTNGVDPEIKWLRSTGGVVFQPDSAKGQFVFIDTGKFLSDDDFSKVVADLDKFEMNFNYALDRDENAGRDFAALKEKKGASLLVVLYADQTAPTMLAAPEDGWAAVNVTKLLADLKTNSAKEKFGATRIRKETIRALAYAAGCGGSGFPDNTMNVATVKDLDFVDEFIPYDTVQNIKALSKKRGVMPRRKTTYRKACKEGWAPAPTNEYQKAVWEKVHEMPTAPIKIKPETKKVTE